MGRRLIAYLLLFRKPISFLRLSKGVNLFALFIKLVWCGCETCLLSYGNNRSRV